jgi:DNA-binding beta-propeller fold protein YncE
MEYALMVSMMPRTKRQIGRLYPRHEAAFRRGLLVVTTLLALAGCATAPQEPRRGDPVFYPPSPNPPRIQYLTSFSGAADIDAKATPFATFIVGEDDNAPRGVTKPYGVAFHNGKLYAVDIRGGGFAIFDLKNGEYRQIRGLKKPINITIDQDGNKWVTDTVLNQVFLYDRDDRPVRAYGEIGQFKPGDVAVIGNKLFVSDLEHHQIKVLDRASGKIVYTIGEPGSAKGQLMYPTNLAVDTQQHLYVSDTINFRIERFTAEGLYVGRVGDIGNRPGHFSRPKGIALDRENRLYVVDSAFQNVQVFDPDGRTLTYFGGSGVGPGQLYLPADISIDYESVDYFQRHAAPGFKLEYVIFVTNQFGPNKINVYGFGRLAGADYD